MMANTGQLWLLLAVLLPSPLPTTSSPLSSSKMYLIETVDTEKVSAADRAESNHPLNEQDFKAAEELKINDMDLQLNEFGDPIDPIVESGYFEGDIMGMLPNSTKSFSMFKGARLNEYSKWPDARVPYEIDSVFDNDQRAMIARAIKEYDRQTCVRFVPRRDEDNYVFFTSGGGCASMVGRVGGRQIIELADGCFGPIGIIMHEMMHALGFYHEQSRSDRDSYVKILTDNIIPSMTSNFLKYNSDNQDLDYDLCSLMHYGIYAFSWNRRDPTIEIIAKHTCDYVGQRKAFSPLDVRRVNLLYPQCNPTGSTRITTASTTTTSSPITTTTYRTSTTITSRTTTFIQPTVSSFSSTASPFIHECEDRMRSSECNTYIQYCSMPSDPNYEVMLFYCKKSCNLCHISTTTKATTIKTTTRPVISENCQDRVSFCDRRECYGGFNGVTRFLYMKTNCKRTCNFCAQ